MGAVLTFNTDFYLTHKAVELPTDPGNYTAVSLAVNRDQFTGLEPTLRTLVGEQGFIHDVEGVAPDLADARL